MRLAQLFMDTVVDIQVVEHVQMKKEDVEARIEAAFNAFRQVEDACSRFSPDSELMQATQKINEPVPISPYLFEPLRFALEMAKMTDGLFDPTIGKTLENYGFNKHYLTKEVTETTSDDTASYQDIVIDDVAKTLLIKKRMVIDLGAVAKGFAIDLAANELKGFEGFLINAGGDIYAGGFDYNGEKWKIGIQHPQCKDKVIDVVEVSNQSVCTSGSYERRSEKAEDVHHIINPMTKDSPNNWVSVSIIAPFAMMADSFSTVVFLSGDEDGKEIIEEVGIEGILINSELNIIKVGGD